MPARTAVWARRPGAGGGARPGARTARGGRTADGGSHRPAAQRETLSEPGQGPWTGRCGAPGGVADGRAREHGPARQTPAVERGTRPRGPSRRPRRTGPACCGVRWRASWDGTPSPGPPYPPSPYLPYPDGPWPAAGYGPPPGPGPSRRRGSVKIRRTGLRSAVSSASIVAVPSSRAWRGCRGSGARGVTTGVAAPGRPGTRAGPVRRARRRVRVPRPRTPRLACCSWRTCPSRRRPGPSVPCPPAVRAVPLRGPPPTSPQCRSGRGPRPGLRGRVARGLPDQRAVGADQDDPAQPLRRRRDEFVEGRALGETSGDPDDRVVRRQEASAAWVLVALESST